MNITLVNEEIEEALVQYIKGQGFDVNDKNIDVTLTIGRGANKHSAKVDITPIRNTTNEVNTEPSDKDAVSFS